MPRSKPQTGGAKSSKRREDIRRNLRKPPPKPVTALQEPAFVNGLAVGLGVALLLTILAVWSREQVHVAIDQVMRSTRVNRIDFTDEDRTATEQQREEARKASPRIYRQNASYLQRLIADLSGLPRAVAGKSSLEEVAPDVKDVYSLTEAGLTALQRHARDGEPTPQWDRWVGRLVNDELRRTPFLDSTEFQSYARTLSRSLQRADGELEQLTGTAIELVAGAEREALYRPVAALVDDRGAGFPSDVVAYVMNRLSYKPEPTILFDAQATDEHARARAAAVAPVLVTHDAGEPIYLRGDRLTGEQLTLLRREREEFRARAGIAAIWLPRFGLFGVFGLLVTLGGAFIARAFPRVPHKPVRLIAMGTLLAGMLAATVVVAAQVPQFLLPAAIAPTLVVTVVLLLAYDQRMGLFFAVMHAAVVTTALEASWSLFVLLAIGAGALVAQLRTVRHRNSLIRASIVTAAALGTASLLLDIMTMPLVSGITGDIVTRAAWAVTSAIGVGFFILGVLPSIERLFDITTGMTLAELRDPSQPLLRELQQRAPGSYNHSLQVASIAEAAADAIGADSLLLYVGALYHDVGKMNKPEYFIENQTSGYNKHAKLSPAMSLLVIIGHVKDGMELAREYGLPRSLQHFIESHHGTTLVEYFYHAAKERTAEDAKAPDEVEFRYPGPKPHTKEAAILMLSDAVESATRAMAEANPSRIESLVHELSRKRLLDGQFDECNLTFRELGKIEDAITQRVCAIHHGRISYPSSKSDDDREDAKTDHAKAPKTDQVKSA